MEYLYFTNIFKFSRKYIVHIYIYIYIHIYNGVYWNPRNHNVWVFMKFREENNNILLILYVILLSVLYNESLSPCNIKLTDFFNIFVRATYCINTQAFFSFVNYYILFELSIVSSVLIIHVFNDWETHSCVPKFSHW